MHLPLQSIAYVNSLTHEGKVVVFATTESTGSDAETFGKVYYTVRQDGFEDNVDRTAMVGWKYWTLLPFIDEGEDLSVRELERKDNDLIRSHYRAAGSLGAVAQVQVVSHREAIYVFRIHRKSNRVLVDRFILNGLTNELMPKLEVRYKRSRQKHKANAKMKIVNGRLEGLDSLDFRDANDLPFSEPTKEFHFMEITDHSQFAVCVVPTTDKDVDRWHFFLPSAKDGVGIVRAVSVRSNRHGEFLLDDQLVIDPAEDENAETVVRSIPSVVEQQFKLTERLGRGIAATNFHIQTEQATKGGPQLIKGAARLLLAFNTSQGRLGTLSFGLSTDGLLSYINPHADEQIELRPSKRRSVFLPVRHMEEVVALGRAEPLPNGKVSAVSRGEHDKTVVHTKEVHGLEAEDQVELNGQQNFNGKYVVRKLSDNKFSLEQNWENTELGDWQLLPKDPEKGLAFEGLITHIEQVGEEIHFSTALDHGLEDELDVLIKHHQALAGQFEVSPIDEHSFAIATDWPPVQVINLFAEAAKRKGLVFDGVQDAVMVEDVLLDLPREDKDFGHTFSCWVKPNGNTINEEQLLLTEGSGTVRISLRAGHIQAVVRLPSGIYSIKDPSRLPADSWSNIALVVERKAAYEPLELRLYRNADLIPAETKRVENPIMAFPNFTDKGLHFGGNSFAQFVYTRNYPPPGRDFTFECWIKPDTVSGHQPLWHTIMPIRTGNFGNIEIETFHAISLLHGGRLRAQLTLMDQDGRPTLTQAESEADLGRDQWAHVAVVGKFTPQGNTVQFIINGKAELPNSIDDGLPLWQQSLQILGRSTPQSGPFADRIRNFKGAIGQLRIWSSALEVNRIIRLASVPVTEGNPSPGGNFIPLKDRMP
ncbi:MAG: LamG-like jellyroll fold domain-containing protein, partial [Bacteroidota bacterium]